MCFSTPSSLIAFAISVIIAAYLWKRNKNIDRWNAAFIISFATIQLWEGILWATNDKNRKNIILKLLLLTLMAQPLTQTFGAWKFTNANILKYFVLLYGLIWIYTAYRAMTEKFTASIGVNGHLVWNTNQGEFTYGQWPIIGLLYLVGLFLGLTFAIRKTWPLIMIGFGTFIYALSNVSTKEFSSYWCYTAVLYSVTALFI